MKQTESGLPKPFHPPQQGRCHSLTALHSGISDPPNFLSHLNTFKYMYRIYTNGTPPQFGTHFFHRLQRVRLEKRNRRLGREFCAFTVFVSNQKLVSHLVLQFSLRECHQVLARSSSKSFFFFFCCCRITTTSEFASILDVKNEVAVSARSFFVRVQRHTAENTSVLFRRIQSSPKRKKKE